jgi:hypothetical protein
MADQAAGGQGNDSRVTCISNGMPRMMTILRQLEIFIRPEIILIVFENNLPRRIYTDGRDFNAKDNIPSYNGYSIGKWIDENGDGKYDVLEVETRNFKGPRNYEPSGLPLHDDNESIIRERMYLDKSNPDTLVNEITTIDNALTRPWTITRGYNRTRDPVWIEHSCAENNDYIFIEGQTYHIEIDGKLGPSRPRQPPPDLRHFNEAQR